MPKTPPVCWKCNQVGHIDRRRSQPMRYGFSEYADTARVDKVAYVCQISAEWRAAADADNTGQVIDGERGVGACGVAQIP